MKPNSLPILAAIFSIVFWVLDSIIDNVFFEKDKSILENMISPEPIELWMRFVVVLLLISFSIYARHLLNKQVQISNELEKNKKELENLATTDSLTLLFNRRKFSEILKLEIERERRFGNGLFLMVCDIDKFKNINDKYGHNIGDEVLKAFAKVLQDSIRKIDVVARWGGEEFVLLIPNTEVDLAPAIANKLRKLIESSKFKDISDVTASFGIACYEENDNEESLFNRADKALYKAKKKGRNRIEVSISSNYIYNQKLQRAV